LRWELQEIQESVSWLLFHDRFSTPPPMGIRGISIKRVSEQAFEELGELYSGE
jgi:hypothetical protein